MYEIIQLQTFVFEYVSRLPKTSKKVTDKNSAIISLPEADT